jgi:hypothetical protein
MRDKSAQLALALALLAIASGCGHSEPESAKGRQHDTLPLLPPVTGVNKAAVAACKIEVTLVETAEELSYAVTSHYEANVAKLVGKYLHSLPIYVARYDTRTHEVVLNAKGAGVPDCRNALANN